MEVTLLNSRLQVGHYVKNGMQFKFNNFTLLYICIRKTILNGEGLSVFIFDIIFILLLFLINRIAAKLN